MEIPARFVIEDDDLDLLWKFTAWLKRVAANAAVDYLRKQGFRNQEISLEQAPEDSLSYDPPLPISKKEFEFVEGPLSKTFSDLNLLRQKILTLTFVEGLTAQETADKLGGSVDVDYVYLQKHRTLKRLRDQLIEEHGSHEN